MSFQRYEKYKAAALESVTEVPEHWSVTTLSRITGKKCDGPFGSGLRSEHYVEAGVRVVRLQNIRHVSFDSADKAFIDEAYFLEQLTRHEVKSGDVLIAGLGDDRNTVGRACVAPADIGPAMVKADCFRFRIDTSRALPDFVAMQLTATSEADSGVLSTGSTRSRIPLSVMAMRRLVLPPLPEQAVIVRFIELQARNIDILIAQQKRLIDLLNEKRQAVISDAVTKGLNPDVPMKPSGVAGLGSIPRHWRLSKMKWVAKMESGHTPDKKVPAYWEHGDVPWVSLNDTGFLRTHDYVAETAYAITQAGIDNSSAHLLPAGAVVFSRDATIGRCAITTRPMAVSQHFIAWICGPALIPEYLLVRLRSMTQELDRLTTRATIKTIGMPEVRTLATPVPPIEEQRGILDYLQRETAKVDALISMAERAIALLQERRTALISAAVTGQIDVRGLARVDVA